MTQKQHDVNIERMARADAAAMMMVQARRRMRMMMVLSFSPPATVPTFCVLAFALFFACVACAYCKLRRRELMADRDWRSLIIQKISATPV